MQRSFVWNYFSRDGSKARCKVQGCNAVLTTKASTPLFYHLEKVHKIYKTTKPCSSASGSGETSQARVAVDHTKPSSKSQKTILECFSVRSLEESVARMAAVDGLTIRQITRSHFIQQALAKEFSKRYILKHEQ